MKRAGEDLLDEAEVEHEGIKWRIDLLQKMRPEDDLYDAEVKVLAEYVRHHVKEEERKLFPRLRLSDFDNAGVGEKLAAEERADDRKARQRETVFDRARHRGARRAVAGYDLNRQLFDFALAEQLFAAMLDRRSATVVAAPSRNAARAANAL